MGENGKINSKINSKMISYNVSVQNNTGILSHLTDGEFLCSEKMGVSNENYLKSDFRPSYSNQSPGRGSTLKDENTINLNNNNINLVNSANSNNLNSRVIESKDLELNSSGNWHQQTIDNSMFNLNKSNRMFRNTRYECEEF